MSEKIIYDVLIIGGGMAGLSAAHELAKAGIKGVVLEKANVFGGKMCSYYDNQANYLGEHGFRIFTPQYYNFFSHVQQIKASSYFQQIGLWECLPDDGCLGRIHKKTGVLGFLVTLLSSYYKMRHWGIRPGLEYIQTLKRFAEASKLQPEKGIELDNQSAFDFLKLADKSKEVQFYFANMLESLNGIDIHQASIYGVAQQFKLFFVNAEKLTSANFLLTLKSPTEDLISRWVRYQEKIGTVFLKNHEVKQCLLNSEGTSIDEIIVNDGQRLRAKTFILATPMEQAENLVPDAITAKQLLSSLEIFSGIQLHIKKSAANKILKSGYLFQLYKSPWKIAFVIQDKKQWPNYSHFNEQIIISLILANWKTIGLKIKKSAFECRKEELIEEILYQINYHQSFHIEKSSIVQWHFDPTLIYDEEEKKFTHSESKLYCPRLGEYQLRPTTKTPLTNLFLAGEYTKTHYLAPSMENANESGRRAAKAAVEYLNGDAKKVEIIDHFAHGKHLR